MNFYKISKFPFILLQREKCPRTQLVDSFIIVKKIPEMLLTVEEQFGFHKVANYLNFNISVSEFGVYLFVRVISVRELFNLVNCSHSNHI